MDIRTLSQNIGETRVVNVDGGIIVSLMYNICLSLVDLDSTRNRSRRDTASTPPAET